MRLSHLLLCAVGRRTARRHLDRRAPSAIRLLMTGRWLLWLPFSDAAPMPRGAHSFEGERGRFRGATLRLVQRRNQVAALLPSSFQADGRLPQAGTRHGRAKTVQIGKCLVNGPTPIPSWRNGRQRQHQQAVCCLSTTKDSLQRVIQRHHKVRVHSQSPLNHQVDLVVVDGVDVARHQHVGVERQRLGYGDGVAVEIDLIRCVLGKARLREARANVLGTAFVFVRPRYPLKGRIWLLGDRSPSRRSVVPCRCGVGVCEFLPHSRQYQCAGPG